MSRRRNRRTHRRRAGRNRRSKSSRRPRRSARRSKTSRRDISRRLEKIARMASEGRDMKYIRSEIDDVASDVEHMTLDEAEQEADETYGDQSDNETYYSDSPRRSRRRRRGGMTLDEAEDEAEDVYGDDLSDNDAYYDL